MDERRTALLFKAFGDENRIHILKLLGSEEQCACRLLEQMHISQPTLSHHMKILCDSGIVQGRKEGKWMHYRIRPEGIHEVRDFLKTLTDSTIETKPCCCGAPVEGICCVKVLGADCRSCHEQYENAKAAVSALGLNVEVEHITDMEKIMEYGVMRMPAIVVNDKVVSMGKVLKAADTETLLRKLG